MIFFISFIVYIK